MFLWYKNTHAKELETLRKVSVSARSGIWQQKSALELSAELGGLLGFGFYWVRVCLFSFLLILVEPSVLEPGMEPS